MGFKKFKLPPHCATLSATSSRNDIAVFAIPVLAARPVGRRGPVGIMLREIRTPLLPYHYPSGRRAFIERGPRCFMDHAPINIKNCEILMELDRLFSVLFCKTYAVVDCYVVSKFAVVVFSTSTTICCVKCPSQD